MASYDVNKINLSLIKQYKDIFETENTRFNNWSYNTFITGYLNNCSDPYVRNMAFGLKRDYEQIKYGYQSISNWWSNYNSGTEDLERKLATSMLESIIDKTINSIDPISLMKYSSFYDGLLDVYNAIFINNIGLKDFSLDKLQSLCEKNEALKKLITLYPYINKFDPITAQNIINSLMENNATDNITDGQVISKLTDIVKALDESGKIENELLLLKTLKEVDTEYFYEVIYNLSSTIEISRLDKRAKEYFSNGDIEKGVELIFAYQDMFLSEPYDHSNNIRDLINKGSYDSVVKYISLLNGNFCKSYFLPSTIFDELIKNGEKEKVNEIIKSSQENNSVIIFDFRTLIEDNPEYKDYLEGIYSKYKDYQNMKYQQIVNELAVKEDIVTFNEYIDLNPYMTFDFNEVIDYMIKKDNAQKALEMISNLSITTEENFKVIDSALKLFVDNYTVDGLVDLLTTSKKDNTIIMIDVNKLITVTKGSDNYYLLVDVFDDYYNYQKEACKEKVIKEMHLNSSDSPTTVINMIMEMERKIGIVLDIDYAKEIADMFLNGLEDNALKVLYLLKNREKRFDEVNLYDHLLKNNDISVLTRFLDSSEKFQQSIISGSGAKSYLENLKANNSDLYTEIKNLFSNYFSSYIKKNSTPEAYAFLCEILKASDDKELNYLYDNLYLLCDNESFSIEVRKPEYNALIDQTLTCYYSPGENKIVITSDTLQNKDIDVIIHELGHCLFYVLTKGNYPLDYVRNLGKYDDRLLTNEDGTYLLNSEASDYMDYLHRYRQLKSEEFKLQYDDPELRSEIIKEVTDKFNSTDMSEIGLLLDETVGFGKREMVAELKGVSLEELNNLSGEQIDLLFADIPKEEIISFIAEGQYNMAENEEFEKYYNSSNQHYYVSALSDIICSILQGKVYNYKKTGQEMYYDAWHSEKYYANNPVSSFNEQIAEFMVLKTFKADEEIEKLRQILGNDWYNMMNEAYEEMASKLGG